MNPQRKFHQEIIRLEIAYVKIHSYEKLASQREAFCRTQKLNAGTLAGRVAAVIAKDMSRVGRYAEAGHQHLTFGYDKRPLVERLIFHRNEF